MHCPTWPRWPVPAWRGAHGVSEPQRPRLEVIYDGDCPFCSSYVAYCRLKEAFPDVTLTNARAVPDRVALYRGKGMDINEGMIVIYGDAVYFGDRAMAILSRISRPDAFLQGTMRLFFRWPVVAGLVYGALRLGRDGALLLLGRSKID